MIVRRIILTKYDIGKKDTPHYQVTTDKIIITLLRENVH